MDSINSRIIVDGIWSSTDNKAHVEPNLSEFRTEEPGAQELSLPILWITGFLQECFFPTNVFARSPELFFVELGPGSKKIIVAPTVASLAKLVQGICGSIGTKSVGRLVADSANPYLWQITITRQGLPIPI